MTFNRRLDSFHSLLLRAEASIVNLKTFKTVRTADEHVITKLLDKTMIRNCKIKSKNDYLSE